MKRSWYLFLLCFLCLGNGCSSRGQADIFPKSVTTFQRTDYSFAFNNSEGKNYTAKYKSPDGKTFNCVGIETSSSDAANKLVKENTPSNVTPEAYTDKKSKKALGMKSLHQGAGSDIYLIWSNDKIYYSCETDKREVDNQTLEAFEQDWQSQAAN